MSKKLLFAGATIALGAMTAAERSKGRYMRGPDHPAFPSLEGKSAGDIGRELKGWFESSLSTVRQVAEKAEGEVKRFGTMTEETKSTADQALLRLNVVDELKSRLDDVEQKMTRPGGAGMGEEVKSFGQQVSESDAIKALASKERPSARIELKAITTANNSAGGFIVSQRETESVNMPRRPDLIMRDLLTVMPIDTGSVDYPKQSVRDNKAAPVAEGTAKPYSNYGWTRATAPVRTIAHLAKLTRQALDDAPRLQAEVDAEMRYGLALAEDSQILLGDGTGENLLGLYPQATAYQAPAGISIAAPNKMDKLRLAMLQASLGLYPADAIVLHETDWTDIELTKDSNGRYIFANPTGVAGPVLWGKRVLSTVSMAQGTFLVGAFRVAATLYDRMAPEVLISSENADDFEKNLLTMRCEERLGLAVKRPAALIKGPFANA
ncbi:phage major capsid protein [Sphingomonas carotinifaciens]|uniref:phage major capsid protein n=1 Tax=Sphingomonas carotinifaciens TaxID=1166323 RepID=UPI001374C814|nr:phage major capsid protein [Sphingomonas carotinifaciens]